MDFYQSLRRHEIRFLVRNFQNLLLKNRRFISIVWFLLKIYLEQKASDKINTLNTR